MVVLHERCFSRIFLFCDEALNHHIGFLNDIFGPLVGYEHQHEILCSRVRSHGLDHGMVWK